MKKELNDYLENIRKIDKKDKIKEKESVLDELLHQIKFAQHERLVHLIVTVFVGISAIMFMGLGIITEIIGFIVLSFITIIMFAFYIFHYYFLENTTQELYKHYFSIREKK